MHGPDCWMRICPTYVPPPSAGACTTRWHVDAEHTATRSAYAVEAGASLESDAVQQQISELKSDLGAHARLLRPRASSPQPAQGERPAAATHSAPFAQHRSQA